MTGNRTRRVRKKNSIGISCDREIGLANDHSEGSVMDKRKLGEHGPAVPALGLGCMGMTGIYGEPNEAESIATIHRAIGLGINLIVTSDAYAAGANEELVARAIKGRRNEVLVATKFGNMALSGFKLPEGLSGGHPGYVPQACDASLKRLGVEAIDIYGLHRVDPKVPIEDTVGAMKRLVDQGKVRYLALSEAGAQTIRRAHKVHPLVALETEYSLWSRDVEKDILPACRELGIGYMAYSPLGRGFLTATIKTLDALQPKDRRGNRAARKGVSTGGRVGHALSREAARRPGHLSPGQAPARSVRSRAHQAGGGARAKMPARLVCPPQALE